MSFFKKMLSWGKERLSNPQIVIESSSPCCPIRAVVEQDNRVAYFYLWGKEGLQFGVKTCWIRNLQEAPHEKDAISLKKGVAPMMPKASCKYPEGQRPLVDQDLEIVWLEEGDGAALLENGEIIAVIPSWSGFGGFSGYARDCKGESSLAWEFTPENALTERVNSAKEFFKLWESDATPFYIKQPQLLELYEELFGTCDKYYAIDGNEWPPKGLFLRHGDKKSIFLTVGNSLLPQPKIEMHYEKRDEVNRIEIGLLMNSELSQEELDKIGNAISGVAHIPWENITFLAEGHTVDFMGLESKGFTSVLLTKEVQVLPKIVLPDYKGSKINILWMIPITDRERKWVMEKGSKGLIEKFNQIGTEVYSLNRPELRE